MASTICYCQRFKESNARTKEGVELALAASAEKSFGTGESKSGRNVNSAARSCSERDRNSSAKDGMMVNITGLLYSGFRCAITALLT